MMLRTEPGLVPVGSAVGVGDGMELVERQRPDVVLLDPHLLDGDGLGLCRRIRALEHPPRVVLYSSDHDATLSVLARVAGGGGPGDKSAAPPALFEAVRGRAPGGAPLPPPRPQEPPGAARQGGG